MPTRSSLILIGLLASAAAAAPTINPQFGDYAVVQRGKPIIISGTSAPNARLLISFAGTSQETLADRNGRWKAAFASRSAGGPFTITAEGTDGIARSQGVMLGDVWLCAGQSNMEYPLPRAMGYGEAQADQDADLRLAKIPHQLAGDPNPSFSNSWKWHRAGPDVKDFSAACYFMVRELRASENVPIGAIDDSWGGTPIRAWMNQAAVRSSGGSEASAAVDVYRRNPSAGLRAFGNEWGAWWRSKTGDRPGQEPWNASSQLSWKAAPSLTYWDNWGPEWKNWIGSAWLRKRVTLTAAEAAEPAILSLSAVDDMDETFVNSAAVGGRNDPVNPRSYPIAKGLLKPGTNEILVFVHNAWGQGGFTGPADTFALIFANGHTRPLTTGWEYSRAADIAGDPPTAPWDGPTGVSTIYNAMVAPLGPIGLKGVAWYQGEADVGKAHYDLRLAAWMANWRSQFHDPILAFLIVGLAGFGEPASKPVESGWASLINEQRIAVERDPLTVLASAIDLGNPRDIHPSDKQEVGRRLALAAHKLVYRDGGSIGALPVSAVRQGNAVVVTFTKPLRILSGANANAFELCSQASGSCRYADARAQGTKIIISMDGQPVSRIRYAWADYPIVNLYDVDMLPCPVFEMPVQ